jgi:acyl carrier protein
MGLDGVELVLEVEEAFGITIADSEAGGIRTVGDLQQLVLSRIEKSRSNVCFSLPAFCNIRRAVRETAEQPDLRLRPSTRFDQVLPASDFRKLWERLQGILGTSPPPLRRPAWMRRTLLAVGLACFALGIATAWIDPVIVPLGLAVAAALTFVGNLLTAPWRRCPPPEMATLGDATRKLVGLVATTRSDLVADDVERMLKEIIVDQLGVDAKEVVPNARFIEDLDMN